MINECIIPITNKTKEDKNMALDITYNLANRM